MDLLSLFFDLLQAFSHTCYPGFKLLFVDQSLSVAINQPGNPLPQSAHPCFEVPECIWLLLLLEQAQILDGELPEDPAAFAARLNRLVLQGLA